MKKYFNRIMTVMICFFTGILQKMPVQGMVKEPEIKKLGTKKLVRLMKNVELSVKSAHNIWDVLHEKGLPCMGQVICRGSPGIIIL